MTLDDPTDIVLADDDHDDLFLLEFALNDIPIHFVLRHATDGDILFQLLAELVPEILFLDIHMPYRDGISCITSIRTNRRYDAMRVVMYSSCTDSDTIEQSFRQGANFFVSKTNSVNDLTDKLRLVFRDGWKEQMTYPKVSEFVL